ncbi:MAG: fasciclin domain-containing protein [Pseudobacter sp.]|uniref:fasciclin domain-containing protein n=1 Tax=Pseudobacter sp. TaxID=2045420 RepID=UPI003F7DB271
MFKYLKSLKICAAVFLMLLSSCRHDNLLVPKPNEHIRPAADFIKNNYDFRLFYAALEYTGLTGDLNAPGPVTVLAVPDNGWYAMGVSTVSQVYSLNKDSLRHALQYHVIKDRRWITTDFATNGVDVRLETMAGESVYVSAVTSGKDYFFDGARIVRSDIRLANGVLQVLNKFMQYHKERSVQGYLSSQPQFSIFVNGLKKFGLWDELAMKGPFTIFAPDNDAYDLQGIDAETINSMDISAYNAQRLFGCYIVPQSHFFVSDQYVFKSLGAEYEYPSLLKDDNWYIQFATSLLSSNPSDRFFTPYPELSLWKPGPNPGSLPVRIGYVPQSSAMLKPLVWYDHLCENGIVHRLHGLISVPADAIK